VDKTKDLYPEEHYPKLIIGDVLVLKNSPMRSTVNGVVGGLAILSNGTIMHRIRTNNGYLDTTGDLWEIDADHLKNRVKTGVRGLSSKVFDLVDFIYLAMEAGLLTEKDLKVFQASLNAMGEIVRIRVHEKAKDFAQRQENGAFGNGRSPEKNSGEEKP
jgi:hypothetical protein